MLRVIILLRILEPSNYRVIDTHLEKENSCLISLVIAEKIRILYVSDIDYWKEASILIFFIQCTGKILFYVPPSELRLHSIADDLSNYYWKNKKGIFYIFYA